MTTTGVTSPSAEVSGVLSLSPFSASKVSPSPILALTLRNCSFASLEPMRLRRTVPPTVGPLALRRLELATAEEVREELEEAWAALDARNAGRESRGGYNAGWRCWDCRAFVAGPTVTCGRCGNRHGGIHHEAYATR